MTKNTSDDDFALFREMVGEVKPVESDRVSHSPAKPPARPRQKEADEQAVLKDMLSDHLDESIESGEEISYHQAGIQKSTLRKLKKGQFAVEAELDLHGYRSEQARQQTVQFLNQAKSKGDRCVRIIHGKGHSREHGPVLKPLLASWLRQRGDVMAFCSARPNDGGTGAVYVLLKRQ